MVTNLFVVLDDLLVPKSHFEAKVCVQTNISTALKYVVFYFLKNLLEKSLVLVYTH